MAKTIVKVYQGGTGAETLTDGGVLLGSGAGAVTATAVLADGEILVGDGTTDPVALDVGSSTAITTLGTVATGTWEGTTIAVDQGGTGATTLTDNSVLTGTGASAITAEANLVFDGSQLGIGMTPSQKLSINTASGAGYLGFYVSGAGKSYIGCSTAAHNPIAEMASGDLGIRVNGGALFLSTDSGITGHLVIDSAGRVTVKKSSNSVITALTSSTSITPDMDDANNFSLTLDHDTTLNDPTNLTAGQSGCIVITQGSTGGTCSIYGTKWHFEGGTTPTLSTLAGEVDTLVYYVASTSSIQAVLLKDIKTT